VPHAWKKRNYVGLPAEVKAVLEEDLDDGIDDIQNGALMELRIHSAFVRQEWSVMEKNDGTYVAVAITEAAHQLAYKFGAIYKPVVGGTLHMPDAGRASDRSAYQDLFAHPVLLKFHLQSAVFQHMKGRREEDGGDVLPDKDLDARIVRLWNSDIAFEEWVESGGGAFPIIA
jgi:hypothetical protein